MHPMSKGILQPVPSFHGKWEIEKPAYFFFNVALVLPRRSLGLMIILRTQVWKLHSTKNARRSPPCPSDGCTAPSYRLDKPAWRTVHIDNCTDDVMVNIRKHMTPIGSWEHDSCVMLNACHVPLIRCMVLGVRSGQFWGPETESPLDAELSVDRGDLGWNFPDTHSSMRYLTISWVTCKERCLAYLIGTLCRIALNRCDPGSCRGGVARAAQGRTDCLILSWNLFVVANVSTNIEGISAVVLTWCD